jgi:hypothetical protein
MAPSDFDVRTELERVQAELARERKRCAALERELAAAHSHAPSRSSLAVEWLRQRWKVVLAVGAGLVFAWLTAHSLATGASKPLGHRLEAVPWTSTRPELPRLPTPAVP